MADEATTSDSQAQDDEVGELASDVATGNSPGSAQPEETQTEAEESSEETSQTSESADTEPEQSDNSELTVEEKEWAAKKNLPLDDPVKLARMYRESEKALGKKGQQEGQLKSAVGEANTSAGVDEVQALRNEVSALSFYIAHPEAKQHEEVMVGILDEKPWLAGDLEAVLDMAKGRSVTEAEVLVAERQAGKKEALTAVAQQQRAAPPRASATTRETAKQVTDADIGNMSQAEYEAWKKDGNDPFSVPAR